MREKYNISKKFLIKEYINNKKSAIMIANQLDYNKSLIYRRLRKYNIKIKTKSEAQKGIYNANFKDGRTLKIYYCKETNCNNIIDYNTWKNGQGRCKLCGYKIVSRKLKGINNGNYIDGRSNKFYPSEFNKDLKYKIRERDNFECQNCDMTEEEHLSIYGRVLDIHHIDYDKQNGKEENLITTCKQCNLRANFNRDYWKDYFTSKIKTKDRQ